MRMQKRLKTHEQCSDSALSTVQPACTMGRRLSFESPSGITEINPSSCGNAIVQANKRIRRLPVLTVGTASSRHSFEQSQRDASRRTQPRFRAFTWVVVLLASALFAAPTVGAAELWRGSVTAVETQTDWAGCESSLIWSQCEDETASAGLFRYAGGRYGPRDFQAHISESLGSREFQVRWISGFGNPSDLIDTELTISVNGTVLNFRDAQNHPTRHLTLRWSNTRVDFSVGDTVTLIIEEPNNPPTTSDSSVTTDEDTAHTFSATEFPFNDTDSGAALDSVTIVTLPSATLGALQLNGTVVSANGQVTNAQLVAGNLQFVPVANANGETSFTFTVNDGEDDSADAATMTVNVTAVNDAPTGLPTISGRAWVGDELTASTTDINDADGLANVDFTYQWLRVDADGISNETAISGATAATYTATADDANKRLRVRVDFTDEGGTDESRTSAAYPSSGTVLGPRLLRDTSGAFLNEESGPNNQEVTLRLFHSLGPRYSVDQTISLRLSGTATLDQDYEVDDQSLVLGVGDDDVTFTFRVLDDKIDEPLIPSETIVVDVLQNGVQLGSTFELSIQDDDGAPSLTFGVDEASIDEAGGVSTITISTGTGSTFPADETIELTLTGTATSGTDYMISSTSLTLPAGMGTNPSSVTATITATQDTAPEGDETVLISASRGGTTFGSQQTVTIADDDTPNWSVSVTTGDIAEAAGSTTLTVSTGGVTYSSDETITLELGGTATRDTDYTFNPGFAVANPVGGRDRGVHRHHRNTGQYQRRERNGDGYRESRRQQHWHTADGDD